MDKRTGWETTACAPLARRRSEAATESESSGDELGILEDDRCIDTGVFQRRYLVHELVFACSPLSPRRLQTSRTILTQADWCAVRAVARWEQGVPPVITTVGSGSRVALIGAWDAMPGTRRFRGQNKFACAVVGPLAISPLLLGSRLPQARYATVVCIWVPIMPWKRMRCWLADAFCRLDPSLALQYDSELDLGSPEALIPETRNPARKTDRSCRNSCYRRFRAQPVRRGLSHPAKPAGESSVQIGLASLARNFGDRMHDPPGSRARCFSSVQQQRSAPRRDGPCRPQRSSTNSAVSQIQCLGLGAWAEQTAPALTVSTTQIRISGNCVWTWTETGATTD